MDTGILSPLSHPPASGTCRLDPEPHLDQTVCHCFAVKESKLRSTVLDHGTGSVEELTALTGAGGGCRACHCRLIRILSGLPAKCSGRFDFCGHCSCLKVNCNCANAA